MRGACLIILLFYGYTIQSILGQPTCKIEKYYTNDGLSHQRINNIVKDEEGFMWFGSWNGINRLDGRSFVSFKSAPGDQFELKNDRINQLEIDHTGNIWILAYDNQVYRFNKQTEQFFPLASMPFFKGKKVVFTKILSTGKKYVWLQSDGEGIFCVQQAVSPQQFTITQYEKGADASHRLPENKIHFLKVDADEDVWIGTSKGLAHLIPTSNSGYAVKSIPVTITAAQTRMTDVAEDATTLFFSTEKGQLISYKKKLGKFNSFQVALASINAILRCKKQNLLYAVTKTGKLIQINVNTYQFATYVYTHPESLLSLFEDKGGKLWIEPENQGVIRFDPATTSFRYFPPHNNEVFSQLGNRFKVLEDRNGRVWVNLKGGGFGYFEPDSSRMGNEVNTPDTRRYPLPKYVYSIYYDEAGVLWLTTYERDLIKLVLQDNRFQQQQLVVPSSSQAENEVRGIYCDRQGRVWAGSKSGQLHVYKNGISVTGLFENESYNSLGDIYTALQDSRGNIWLGTKANGLYKATPANLQQTRYQLTHFLSGSKHSDSLQCNDIYSLLEDKQGRIWLGSFDNGLTLITDSPQGTRFTHASRMIRQYPHGSFNRIRHMELDGRGNIWMGTTNGVLVLNINGRQVSAYTCTTYTKIPGDRESLGNNDVQFINRDAKNRMWLGTSGGGFCEAIGADPLQSLRFVNYTTREGMPNDYVLSFTGDRQGNLWIATENGLTKFNPDNKTFRNYDSYDGLPKATFSESAVGKTASKDELFFGTTDGILSFYPEQLHSQQVVANIVFTQLHINNEEAGPRLSTIPLEKDINYLSELRLKYDQNLISIDYAILDYRTGNRQSFAYRLIGFDSTWHDDRQQRRATYTNLPPGHYVFEVKSGNVDLYQNQPIKRLFITIQPPPWQTWWAYLLYIVAIAAILYYLRRKEMAIMNLRNKVVVEQKLAALKLNFFTNVSHELRTPLTLIVNPLEQLARKEKLSAEGSSYIDVARKNAARMVRFINQLLDLRKVQSDKAVLQVSRVEILPFVKRVADHFIEMARNKQIDLNIAADEDDLVVWVDAEKLDVVLYNLLGNAFKFTPDGKSIQVSIHHTEAAQIFSIAVSDQGPGVQKEELEEIFELFHEGQQLETRAAKGTGIGLALSREFVKLHGGKIWAENNPDGGLTVTMQLQLGADHYKADEVSFVDTPLLAPMYEQPLEQTLLPLSDTALPPKDDQSPMVLLVEDNDDLRAFLRRQLGEHYRVETARDGEEGSRKAADLLPDLIVSDIMMPNMDGIQMLDIIKNKVETSHIPVVLLSAKHAIESQIEGLKYGADYYITKPFNNTFLMTAIDNLLRQRRKLFESLVQAQPRQVELKPGAIVITSKDEVFLKDVLKVVETKMTDVDFNIELIADTMAMSRTTFNKKFKSLTNMTPVEFVRDMRLQRAKQYLDGGEINISDIAYEAGFNSPKYFSTCFKEKYGISPSDYLKAKKV